ncbi:hypothetical protein D6764_00060, partial [Candidatus Woesearchaeota archaeon]
IGIKEESLPYVIVDFESYGQVRKINSLTALPANLYAAAASARAGKMNELDDGRMIEADMYIERFLEGYLEKGIPEWLDIAIKSNLHRHASAEEAMRSLQLHSIPTSNNLSVIVDSISEILEEKARKAKG